MKLLEVKTEDTYPYEVVRHKPACLPFLYAYVVEELEEDICGNSYHFDDGQRPGVIFDLEIQDCEGCAPLVDTRDPDEIPF